MFFANLTRPGAREKYGPVFEALLPDMPAILASYSAPAKANIASSIAEYAVARKLGGARRLFLVYFIRGFDGVWRLSAM